MKKGNGTEAEAAPSTSELKNESAVDSDAYNTGSTGDCTLGGSQVHCKEIEKVDLDIAEMESHNDQQSDPLYDESSATTPPPFLMEPIVEMTSPMDVNKHGCPQCGKVYKQKGTLAFHLRYECGKEPQFSCEFCDYKAKRKTSLNSHIAFRHKDMINTYLNK